MKMAKALKLKNRLAGEVAKLKAIVVANNSRDASVEQNYDVREILGVQLPKRIWELVTVKTEIACSNAHSVYNSCDIEKTPFWAIFMMAELKGLIETVKGMDTKNGSFDKTSFSGAELKPQVFVAAYKQSEVDGLVSTMEKQIDVFQDFLDIHNATWDCSYLDSIVV